MFCVNLWAIEVDLSPFKVCHRWCFLEDDVGVPTANTFKFVSSVFDWLFCVPNKNHPNSNNPFVVV